MRQSLFLVALGSFFVFPSFFCASFVKAVSTPEVERIQGSETRRFVVSAYYSPLPNQESYVRGTYAGDLRLNGDGTHGADGTAVYVGMLAAPKTYDFGTKISIPGLGVGTVHDRGGAILPYKDFDRIDVWMGYGDAGRRRALQWGMRSVTGEIVPSTVADAMNFEVSSPALGAQYSVESAHYEPQASGKGSLWKGAKGESVENLQKFLREEGFFNGADTGYYGDRTEDAVFAFQKAHGIVSLRSSSGAGVFGPKTREKFDEIWIENDELSAYAVDVDILPESISSTENGADVKRLQMALASLGHFHETPNGIYGPKTKASVLEYQMKANIVSSHGEKNAGEVGLRTRKSIEKSLLLQRKNISKSLDSHADSITQEQLTMRQIKIPLEKYAVAYGERSDNVKKLQKELIKRGFLAENLNTGFYGQQTQSALDKYKKYLG